MQDSSVLAPTSSMRRWATVIGFIGAALLVATVAGVITVNSSSDRGLPAPGASVPAFGSTSEAIAYYDGEREALLGASAALPSGYDDSAVESVLNHLDAAVSAERRDPFADAGLIAQAGFLAATLRAAIEDQLARQHDSTLEPSDLRVNWSGTDAEEALDRLSGGSAILAIDPWDSPICPKTAIACAGNWGDVHITAGDSLLSNEMLLMVEGIDWDWVMRHEYAHVVQSGWGTLLTSDPRFQELFVDIPIPDTFNPTLDYAIEHSADCMAVAADPGYRPSYPGECTPDQVEFARTIWDGSFVR